MDWMEFFKGDLFAADSGAVLETVSAGYAKATLNAGDRHLNAGGVVQGGAIFTLADFAMAAAANAHGVLAFSIQSDIRFLESAQSGEVLTATVRELLLKRTIAHYRVEVRGNDNRLIAVFDGICHRKQPR